VRYPHGAPFGVPGDRMGHLTVLRDLFWAAQDLDEPGTILDPGYRWRRTSWEAVETQGFLRASTGGGPA